jgi:hypothetical protein
MSSSLDEDRIIHAGQQPARCSPRGSCQTRPAALQGARKRNRNEISKDNKEDTYEER